MHIEGKYSIRIAIYAYSMHYTNGVGVYTSIYIIMYILITIHTYVLRSAAPLYATVHKGHLRNVDERIRRVHRNVDEVHRHTVSFNYQIDTYTIFVYLYLYE